MSLIIGANTSDFRTYELPQVVILANQALPTDGILLLEVNWKSPPYFDYDTGNGGIGTLCYQMRWRINNSNWTVEDIVQSSAVTPLKPSFLGMQLDYLQANPSNYSQIQPISGSGWWAEQWYLKGTPSASGLLEIQFAVHPNDVNNPFA